MLLLINKYVKKLAQRLRSVYFLLNLFLIKITFNQQLITIIMNKSELIDAIAADAGITKAAAKLALESFLGNVGSTLKKGGRVSLVGFGSWSVSNRAARDGRNPQTGKTIKIAAKNVVKFKAGADLEGSVNK
jgi:DNA-binding protein HU-beta